MNTIDLGIGHVNSSILPLEEVIRSAQSLLTSPGNSCLQYGPEQGSRFFRRQLADFLTRNYGMSVTLEMLLVTAGASHGLDLVLSRLGRPGATILVEAPTYFFALDIFRDHGLNVISIPADDEGLDLDALERHLARNSADFLYTIPVFHNPTGRTLPHERRSRLVELAREYGFRIIADEVYHLLGQKGEIPAPLVAYDPSHVISLGSFSKILGPGLRLGWIQITPESIPTLLGCGVLRSGGGVNPLVSAIVETMLREGRQDEYLARARIYCDTRRRFMIQCLQEALPASTRFVAPRGGYFIWLELPPNVDVAQLRREAVKAGIDFKPGSLFSWDGALENCLRLCFTYYEESQLEFACRQLGDLLRKAQ